MSFHPSVGDVLTIGGAVYRMTEHPAAPGIPYGQEGRQAVVYRIADDQQGQRALKVFKPRYRMPALVSLAERIAPFAKLPGLQACQRIVITPQQNADLLRQQPDLIYAVLMPWVTGPTWMEVLLEQRVLTPAQSLALARSLAEILAVLEQRGVAHCDLSGPNVLLPALVATPVRNGDEVALVDVEQLYASNLDRPAVLPGGSPGYAHKTAPDGLWVPDADRFAGAVLITEILGWCDSRMRKAAWGEGYFDPQEMQQETDRYRSLLAVLSERYGQGVAGLLERSWRSDSLAACPTFGEWLLVLPAVPSEDQTASDRPGTDDNVSLFMAGARRKENAGDLTGAIADYQTALQFSTNTTLRAEVAQVLALLQNQLAVQERVRKQANQARAHEQAAQWQDAAASYVGLLHEERDPAQRQTWQSSLDRCHDELRLSELADLARQAIAQGRWSAATELLDEIICNQPAYRIGPNTAKALRDEVQRRLVESQEPTLAPRRRLAPVLLGGMLLIAVGLVFLLGIPAYQQQQAQRQHQAKLTAAVPWLTVTAQAESTAAALATQQAQATGQAAATQAAVATERAARTVEAQKAQATLQGVFAANTAQAQQTGTAIASERATLTAQARSTQGALDRAATATAESQAQAATATAETRARAAAQANATATAQAGTDTARQSATPPPPDWVSIPGGSFTMGSTEEQIRSALAECDATEGKKTGSSCQRDWFQEPVRIMNISGFQITRFEITNIQYNACVAVGVCAKAGRARGDTNISYDPGYFANNLPVVAVSWHDADTFCRWSGGRLPTEEEWERAARGSDSRRYPWGNIFDPAKANLDSGYPSPVGAFPGGASPYGVMDMAGNVFEWTSTQSDGRFVVRGGGWTKYYFRGRVTDRGTRLEATFANYDVGFRCVR